MSALSVRAFEADNLVNGIYRCFVRTNQIVITDEFNEWVIGQTDIDELEEAIEALETALDGKANLEHTHSIDDITNLQDTLDGKASTSHNHSINDITNLQDTLNGKASTSHEHSINDITNLQDTLDDLEDDIAAIETALNGKSNVGHGHVISDVSNLQTTLDGKAPLSHEHSIDDIYKTETTTDENQQTITITKTLNQVLDEKENALIALINGKAPSSHTHNATEVYYSQNVNVKQEIDNIHSKITRVNDQGTAIDIIDAIFGTGADIGLLASVSALQDEITALQGQVGTLAAAQATANGIYGINNTTDGIMEVCDDLSEFSDVAAEGRTWIDSLSDWFSSFRQRIAGQTTRYNQLIDDFTPPSLSSVSNESALYVI